VQGSYSLTVSKCCGPEGDGIHDSSTQHYVYAMFWPKPHCLWFALYTTLKLLGNENFRIGPNGAREL
jgi:hypothetical protein